MYTERTLEKNDNHSMSEKLRKSINEMISQIDSEKQLERIHQFTQYIYIKK